MTTRREFVTSLGAAAIGAGTQGYRSPLPAPEPGGGIGTLGAAEARIRPLGVQLYTVRDLMRRDVEGTLARVGEIGYREVEWWGSFDRTPAQLSSALRAAGLTSPSAHVGLETLEGDAGSRTIATAQEIGHHYLVVASMPVEWRRTLDDWRRVAERMNRVGERLRAAGMQYAYHNHDFEFRPLEGRIPFDVLCESTDPGLVQIEVDLFWIIHGGGDPLAFFSRWPGRVPMVHVKDRTADGRMVDVGAGVIDWRAIFARRAQAGIRHYFVEHDEPPDPMASIAASYRYLSRLSV